MDRIIAVLSYLLTLLIRLNVWQRAGIVLAVFLLVVFVMWKALCRVMRVVLGVLVKGFYLFFCEFLFHLMNGNADQTSIHRRNAMAERCEKLYGRMQAENGRQRKSGAFLFVLLYAVAMLSITAPYIGGFLGSEVPAGIMPAVSAVTNIYHRVEMPILRQSMRLEPVFSISVSSLNDVEEQNPYSEGIQFACSRGLLESNDSYFCPDDALTRENLAVMLYRYSGEAEIGYLTDASDVPLGKNSYCAVSWCVEQGILTLEEDGTFSIHQQVANEEFLTALARYAEANGLSTKVFFDLSAVPGSDGIHDWAVNACKWAAKQDMLILDENGYFIPEEPLSREKAAQLFFQYSVWESSLAK